MSLKLIAMEVLKKKMEDEGIGGVSENLRGKEGRKVGLLLKLSWLTP